MTTESKKSRSDVISDLALGAMLVALAVVGSTFSIPFLTSRLSPVQHLVNILAAYRFSEGKAVGLAFIASLIRNILSLGSILAFPGSMFGAYLAALLYRKTSSVLFSILGEILGTGLLGSLTAYLLAKNILNASSVGALSFVIPFLLSSLLGAITAGLMLKYFDFYKSKKR